jgi:hypothetical protein
MCRFNINKCHSYQTGGNSNFTLFQIVYFFQRQLAQVFIRTHDISVVDFRNSGGLL